MANAEGSLSASAITGEQLYAPYGTTRYTVGTLGTAKAFTGQEADPLTGLYYYHARWYDPVVGVFVSVDTQEGNAQGVNPYGYVRENPETVTDPTGERACAGINNCPVPNPPQKAPPGTVPGGSPTQTPTSGGCDAGMHPRPGDGMCVHDGSNCPIDMQSGKGGCVFSGGECQGLTEKGCDQFKLEQRIHRAQEDAKNEVIRLSILLGIMLLFIADFGGWIARLQAAATFFAGLAVASLFIGAAIFGGLSILFAGAALVLAASMSTLVAGVLTDSVLIGLFLGRANDDNAADWTPAALSKFDSQVTFFTGFVNNVITPLLTFFTGGGPVGVLLGTVEPTSVFYGFSGIDSTLDQMTSDMQ